MMKKIRAVVIRKDKKKPELIIKGKKVITSYKWKVEGNLGKTPQEIRVLGSEALFKPINERSRLEVSLHEYETGDKENPSGKSDKHSG